MSCWVSVRAHACLYTTHNTAMATLRWNLAQKHVDMLVIVLLSAYSITSVVVVHFGSILLSRRVTKERITPRHRCLISCSCVPFATAALKLPLDRGFARVLCCCLQTCDDMALSGGCGPAGSPRLARRAWPGFCSYVPARNMQQPSYTYRSIHHAVFSASSTCFSFFFFSLFRLYCLFVL